MNRRVYLTILMIITAICMIFGTLRNIRGWSRPFRMTDQKVVDLSKDSDAAGREAQGSGGRIGEAGSSAEADAKAAGSGSAAAADAKAAAASGAGAKDAASSEEVSRIDIETDVVDIDIAAGGSYEVQYSGDKKYEPSVSLSGGVLKIEQKVRKKSWIGVNVPKVECSLKITIPEGTVLSEVEVENDVGDLKIEDLEITDGSIDTDVGDIDISDCRLGMVGLGSDVGDVRVRNCSFRNLDIRLDVGDADISSTDDLSDAALDLKAGYPSLLRPTSATYRLRTDGG